MFGTSYRPEGGAAYIIDPLKLGAALGEWPNRSGYPVLRGDLVNLYDTLMDWAVFIKG